MTTDNKKEELKHKRKKKPSVDEARVKKSRTSKPKRAMSEFTKNKISNTLKSVHRKLSDEQKRKMQEGRKRASIERKLAGKSTQRSEETRKKISESLKKYYQQQRELRPFPVQEKLGDIKTDVISPIEKNIIEYNKNLELKNPTDKDLKDRERLLKDKIEINNYNVPDLPPSPEKDLSKKLDEYTKDGVDAQYFTVFAEIKTDKKDRVVTAFNYLLDEWERKGGDEQTFAKALQDKGITPEDFGYVIRYSNSIDNISKDLLNTQRAIMDLVFTEGSEQEILKKKQEYLGKQALWFDEIISDEEIEDLRKGYTSSIYDEDKDGNVKDNSIRFRASTTEIVNVGSFFATNVNENIIEDEELTKQLLKDMREMIKEKENE